MTFREAGYPSEDKGLCFWDNMGDALLRVASDSPAFLPVLLLLFFGNLGNEEVCRSTWEVWQINGLESDSTQTMTQSDFLIQKCCLILLISSRLGILNNWKYHLQWDNCVWFQGELGWVGRRGTVPSSPSAYRGFRMGGGWTGTWVQRPHCYCSCTGRPGLGKTATHPTPGLCRLRVAWVQLGRVNNRQRKMARIPLSPKFTFLVGVITRIIKNRIDVLNLFFFFFWYH